MKDFACGPVFINDIYLQYIACITLYSLLWTAVMCNYFPGIL